MHNQNVPNECSETPKKAAKVWSEIFGQECLCRVTRSVEEDYSYETRRRSLLVGGLGITSCIDTSPAALLGAYAAFGSELASPAAAGAVGCTMLERSICKSSQENTLKLYKLDGIYGKNNKRKKQKSKNRQYSPVLLLTKVDVKNPYWQSVVGRRGFVTVTQ